MRVNQAKDGLYNFPILCGLIVAGYLLEFRRRLRARRPGESP